MSDRFSLEDVARIVMHAEEWEPESPRERAVFNAHAGQMALVVIFMSALYPSRMALEG